MKRGRFKCGVTCSSETEQASEQRNQPPVERHLLEGKLEEFLPKNAYSSCYKKKSSCKGMFLVIFS